MGSTATTAPDRAALRRGVERPTAQPSPRSAWSKADRRVQLYLLLLLADLGAVTLGFLFAGAARPGGHEEGRTGELLSVVLPMFAVISFHRAAYSVDALRSWTTGLRRSLGSLGAAAVTVVGIGFAWKVSSDYSRLVVLVGTGGAAALLTAGRWAANRIMWRLLPDGPVEEVVLLDGDSVPAAGRIVLDARRLGLSPDLDCPDSLDRLGRALGHVDRIIVACAPARRRKWVTALKSMGVDVEIFMPEAQPLGLLGLGQHDGRLTALVARGQLALRQRVLKRGLDLAVVVWFMPTLLLVTLVVAALIKWEDGGPVFFRQKRIGRANRTFLIYKFRTMRAEAADRDGAVSAARADGRVTRVGAVLRRTSIDELPQLLNVLLGEMSLVGPRPHAVGSTADRQLFWAVDRRYWLRHAAKPGLTGLAQVRGWRGATETRDDLVNRIQADLEYLNGWSLWRDIRILAATAKVVLHPNAF